MENATFASQHRMQESRLRQQRKKWLDNELNMKRKKICLEKRDEMRIKNMISKKIERRK